VIEIIILTSLARLSVSFSFSFFVIWVSEQYPTTIRSAGVGIIFGIGLLGAQISPFLVKFSDSID